MRHSFKYTLVAFTMLASTSLSAQNLNSAYFLDGYTYGHELNPAKDYDRKSYFTIPFLPSINFGLNGNLGVKDIFMPNPNGSGLVTYLHPSISLSEALKGINDKNKFIENTRIELLGFGFHTKHAYNTFSLSVRSNVGLCLPGEMFRMTKELQNKDYNLSNLGAQANAWLESSWGYSRNVNEAWRVGGKVKLLLGLAHANVKMDNLSLNLENPDEWTASAQASAEIGLKGASWGPTETKEYKARTDAYGNPKTYQQINLDNLDVENPGLGGVGFGVDLGAEWDLGKQEIAEGLKVSAALLDLSFINWNNIIVARNQGEEFKFTGFNNIKVEDGDGVAFEDQTDDIADRLSDLYSLQDGGTMSKARGVGATLNIGVEYALPQYDKLSFGLLSTTRIQGNYSWNEERVSATVSPAKWFEASANLGVGTFGASLGWVLNVHPRGFNVFLGMDHVLGKLSKQGIPLKSNADLTMGITFPLGKSRIAD